MYSFAYGLCVFHFRGSLSTYCVFRLRKITKHATHMQFFETQYPYALIRAPFGSHSGSRSTTTLTVSPKYSISNSVPTLAYSIGK